MTPSYNMLQVALAYRQLGWAVVPINVASGDKEPFVRWKHFSNGKPPPRDAVERWFTKPNVQALAVLLGQVSRNLICRDFDDLSAYEAWRAEFPELARTLPTVSTGRPGRHVYVYAESLEPFRQASKSSDRLILPLGDGEFKAGGYTLLPPSPHPIAGRPPYKWGPIKPSATPRLDLLQTGLLRSYATERTESTERTETTETTEQTEAMTAPSVNRTNNIEVLYAGLPDRKLPEPIQVAILRTLPTGPGRRNRQVFELARALKALPALADAPAAALKHVVRVWHGKALEFISTKPFDDSWIDFLYAWPKVKFPAGDLPMVEVLERAAQRQPPAAAEQFDHPQIKLLVALCRELQRANGREPFFLACRTVAALMKAVNQDIDHATAARWLKLLVFEGVLHVTTPGTKTKAARYRYLPEIAD